MGMDGLSFANTGIKETTSAEYSAKTEQSVQSAANNPKQVDGLAANQRVKEKEDNEEKSSKKNKKQDEEFEDGLIEDNQEEEINEESEIEDIENPNKDFYVKLNSKDDTIELYDSFTNRLIETISGDDLTNLVSKLNMVSGIFVNKKV